MSVHNSKINWPNTAFKRPKSSLRYYSLVGKKNAGNQEVYSQRKMPPLITSVGEIIQQELTETTECLQDLSKELQRIDERVFELVEKKRERMRKSINKKIKVIPSRRICSS